MVAKITKGVLLGILIVAGIGGIYLLYSSGIFGATSVHNYRVGILVGSDTFLSVANGFRQRLTELGYAEGKNITYDVRRSGQDQAVEKQSLQKFRDDKDDLVLALPVSSALNAKAALEGSNIPLIFAIANIENTGLVDNIARPGDHITGIRLANAELSVKRLEILHEMVPKAKHIWLGYSKDYVTTQTILDSLRPAAQWMGLTLVEVPAASLTDLRTDLEKRATSKNPGIDAVAFLPDPLGQTTDAYKMAADITHKLNIPLAGSWSYTTDLGALFSYAPDTLDIGKAAANDADKILRGAMAGDIPVQTSESYLRINYRNAQDLGLNVPDNLLEQATEIIR